MARYALYIPPNPLIGDVMANLGEEIIILHSPSRRIFDTYEDVFNNVDKCQLDL